MNEWFKTWFNSEDYLTLYKHRDDEDAQRLIKLVFNNVDGHKLANVLDVACGAGRHSIIFAKKGLKVTAFDISKNLLKIGKERAGKDNLKVDFFCGDVRKVCLKKQFDIVINFFTSFGYFENDGDNFMLFSDAYDYLRKDGYFCFDYFNIEYLKNNLVPLTVSEEAGISITQKRKISGNRVIKEIMISSSEGSNKFYESVALYSRSRIETEMKNRGFIIGNEFGDYYGSYFNLNESPRLTIFAKK